MAVIKFINWELGTSELLPQNYRTPGDTISSVHSGGHVYKLISTSKFQDISDTCNMKLGGQQSILFTVYGMWRGSFNHNISPKLLITIVTDILYV